MPTHTYTHWDCLGMMKLHEIALFFFKELMILQSSSSVPTGPYGLGVHFQTRFMSTLSTLGQEHIIYYLLTASLSIVFFPPPLVCTCKACKYTETHIHKNTIQRDTVIVLSISQSYSILPSLMLSIAPPSMESHNHRLLRPTLKSR